MEWIIRRGNIAQINSTEYTYTTAIIEEKKCCAKRKWTRIYSQCENVPPLVNAIRLSTRMHKKGLLSENIWNLPKITYNLSMNEFKYDHKTSLK